MTATNYDHDGHNNDSHMVCGRHCCGRHGDGLWPSWFVADMAETECSVIRGWYNMIREAVCSFVEFQCAVLHRDSFAANVPLHSRRQ